MTLRSTVLAGCQDGRGCVEVVARLVAADRAAAEGFDEAARELREKAEAWARRHDHGQGEDGTS
jgi:hypothetical protein